MLEICLFPWIERILTSDSNIGRNIVGYLGDKRRFSAVYRWFIGATS